MIVFELRKLGDAILSVPFIRSARRRHDVYVVCHPSSVPVFASVMPEDRVLPWIPPWVEWEGGRKALGSCVEIVRRVRALHPAIAVCGWADARVEVLMGWSGAGRRIGFPMNSTNYYAWRVPWRSRHLRRGQWLHVAGRIITGKRLLTDALVRQDEHQRHLEDWRQVAAVLGVDWDVSLPWMAPPDRIDPGLKTTLDRWRSLGRPVWCVHPGAGSLVKQWSAAGFSNVVRNFYATEGIPLVMIQLPGERCLHADGDFMLSYTPPDIPSLMALTARVDAVLCNDSMMAHLAAAMGKRVVSVFGPSDPGAFAPFANERGMVVKDVCTHRPCMDRCLMESPICMEAIGVEDVIARVRDVNEELMKSRIGGQGSVS